MSEQPQRPYTSDDIEEAVAHARALQQRIDGALPYLTAILNKPFADRDILQWADNAVGLLAPTHSDQERQS